MSITATSGTMPDYHDDRQPILAQARAKCAPPDAEMERDAGAIIGWLFTRELAASVIPQRRKETGGGKIRRADRGAFGILPPWLRIHLVKR